MAKIVQGYWDCPYCGNKEMSGLSKRCTACGHPQDEDTKFYLKEQKEYVNEEEAQEYGKGADWTCSYCNSLNRYDATVCIGCGADREESSGNYFENLEEQKKKEEKKKAEADILQNMTPPKKKSRLGLIIGIAVLIALIAFACRPRNYSATVSDKSWQREIGVDVYKTVSESGWTLPDTARMTDSKEEVHHIDSVLDHYETVEVERSRQVIDGYDTHTEYIDNGDGTFTENTYQTPRYTTEYYTEQEERPVYRDVPRYATKYYYDIEKWVPDRVLKTSGGDDEPYWDTTVLGDKERENGRSEQYSVTFSADKGKSYYVVIDQSLWDTLKVGSGADIEVKNGRVVMINGNTL